MEDQYTHLHLPRRCLYCLTILVALIIGGCSDGVSVTEQQFEAPTSPNPEPPVTPIEPVQPQPPLPVSEARLSVHNDGFEGDFFSGAGQCSDCHNDLTDELGNDVSIVRDWSTSMMANSARDPYWIAKVAAEVQRNPSLADEIDDTCSRCHAPMANDTGRKQNTPVKLLGDNSILNDDNALFDHAMEGVSCTLCHQVRDDGLLGTVEGTSGNFDIAVQARRSDRPAYGPYVDPLGVRMRTQSQFNPVFGEHITQSKTCAACHDLRTPAFGEQGETLASDYFPEQMVYSEWLNSVYAQPGESERNCQSCHMPEVEGSMLIASSGGGILREGFSRHTFLGGNTVMQNILMNNADALGIRVPREEFEKSISRNREFLATSAAIDIVSSEREGSDLVSRVRVQNLAGHKLPSGFASRRVLIHFVVRDANGSIVFESGKLNADGSVVGINTDTDSLEYEPHYDVISTPDQVQVYEAIMGDSAQQVTHTLLNASVYLKDNRLLPAGFDKLTAADDILTRGLAFNDVNFDAMGDEIVYRVPVASNGDLTVSASLVYQPLAYGHLQDLFAADNLDDVAYFKGLFDAATLKAELLANDTQAVVAQ